MQTQPQAIGITRNPKDGAEMVWIPGGEFQMGNGDKDIAAMVTARPDWKTDWFADERPRHTVMVPGYWMYKYPVTVAQYRRFCDATEREMPELPTWAKDDFPMVNVTWFDAAAYAKWAGVRLPSEAEWEKAARGIDARMFPWGNVWNVEYCNNYSDTNPRGGGYQGKMASPVGAYSRCASPFGVQDMAGNVWE
ncbi:MAG TPA: formylglycine-generating enzyme family protein, partial [Armatimonadota bacterium]